GFSWEEFARFGMVSLASSGPGKGKAWVVSSPTVKALAQQYYNCSTLEGMKLEDAGYAGSKGSHWKALIAKEEMMSPAGQPGYYSAFTLAAFADMGGVYRANFSMAEPMRWGNNSGCGLLEKKCLTGGHTDYPDMFCKQFWNDKKLLCTHDRLSLGNCDLGRQNQPLPPQYQYFEDPRLGGREVFMDYCPHVTPRAVHGCTNGKAHAIIGSFIGPNSRCVKGKDLQVSGKPIGDVCVNTQCDGGKLKVQFRLDTTWHECEEGKTVEPPRKYWSGSIVCPKYADVCDALPNISAYPIPVVAPPLTEDPPAAEDTEAAEGENGDAEVSPVGPGGEAWTQDAAVAHSAGTERSGSSKASETEGPSTTSSSSKAEGGVGGTTGQTNAAAKGSEEEGGGAERPTTTALNSDSTNPAQSTAGARPPESEGQTQGAAAAQSSGQPDAVPPLRGGGSSGGTLTPAEGRGTAAAEAQLQGGAAGPSTATESAAPTARADASEVAPAATNGAVAPAGAKDGASASANRPSANAAASGSEAPSNAEGSDVTTALFVRAPLLLLLTAALACAAGQC
ncbi:leishmanolysin, partial [Trypanosoma conorhini]